MSTLDMVREWLLTFPGWELGLAAESMGDEPGAAGLYWDGEQLLQNQQDLQGNAMTLNRLKFTLLMNTASRQEGYEKLQALWQWFREQVCTGKLPSLGNVGIAPCLSFGDVKTNEQRDGTLVYGTEFFLDFWYYREVG